MTLDLDEVEKACAEARPGSANAFAQGAIFAIKGPEWCRALVAEVKRLRTENAQLLEKAAKVAETFYNDSPLVRVEHASGREIAAAIRALGAK